MSFVNYHHPYLWATVPSIPYYTSTSMHCSMHASTATSSEKLNMSLFLSISLFHISTFFPRSPQSVGSTCNAIGLGLPTYTRTTAPRLRATPSMWVPFHLSRRRGALFRCRRYSLVLLPQHHRRMPYTICFGARQNRVIRLQKVAIGKA